MPDCQAAIFIMWFRRMGRGDSTLWLGNQRRNHRSLKNGPDIKPPQPDISDPIPLIPHGSLAGRPMRSARLGVTKKSTSLFSRHSFHCCCVKEIELNPSSKHCGGERESQRAKQQNQPHDNRKRCRASGILLSPYHTSKIACGPFSGLGIQLPPLFCFY